MVNKIRSPRARRSAWLGAVVLAMLASAPAHAALNQLHFANSYDGTPGWDPVPGPGFDTGPDNRIVRTGDQFEYLVTFSTDGGGDDDVTLVATLPLGNVAPRAGQPVAHWSNVPAGCGGAGSGISADGQTLTCNLGSVTRSGTRSVFLNATVLSLAPNGTALPAPGLQASSSSTPALDPSTTPQPLIVTAAPFYDVVVQMSHQGNPRAYGYWSAGGPGDEDGYFHRPLVGLVAKNPNGNGRKGVEQLDPAYPVSYVLDISGYPAGVRLDNWHDGSAPFGTPGATGTFAGGCGSPGHGRPSEESGSSINIYDKVNDAGPVASTAASTVPNGGTCLNAAQAGSTISFDVAGIDTSLQRRPSVTGGSIGSPVPVTDWWVSNKALVLWTPLASYPANVNIGHEIRLGSASGRSITGQAITGDDPTNNRVAYELRNLPTGGGSKVYTRDAALPVPFQTTCDPAITGDCHVNFMTPAQTVTGRVHYQNNGADTHAGVYVCEIIDRTAFDLAPHFNATPTTTSAGAPVVRYGTRPGGPHFASTDAAASAYAAGSGDASEYASARCDDPGIQWFNTAAEAEAAGGLVYVRADLAELVGGTRLFLAVQGLRLRDTWAATIQVLSPAPATRVAGSPIPEGTILRNRGELGSPVPSIGGLALRDHLEVVRLRTTSRVGKSIVAPANGETAPQPVGGLLTYRLQPRFSTLFPPVEQDLTVTDVLPPHLEYLPGTATVGGVAREPEVSYNTPAAGYTRLRWTFPDLVPYLGADGVAANTAAIEFQAQISLAAADSVVLGNSVAVAAASDYEREADCVYSTASQGFGACVKSASANVQVQTPPGFQLQKSTVTQVIEPGMDLRYRIQFGSFGSDVAAPDIPHFIDILPYPGDGVSDPARMFAGRAPASQFAPGAWRLASVVVPANDPAMQVYYTSRAPDRIHNDPRHASNAPGGATRWCLATELGSPGCPLAVAEATAVRLAPGVPVLTANTLYGVELVLATDRARATFGDVFANSVGGRSPDPASALLYVSARANPAVRLAPSRISGVVFADANDDGVHDTGESGIAGTQVTLDGCTAGANGVLDTAAIPEAGALACAGDDVPLTRTMDTDADGEYAFADLFSGIYRIAQAQPDGYADGKRHVGSAGGTANAQGAVPSVVTDIALPVGTAASGYDFGELLLVPALSVSKTADPASGTAVTPGQTLTYTLTVTVADAATTAPVTLTDTLGAGLALVAGTIDTPAGASCSAAGPVLTCELPAGAAVGSHAFSYQAMVDAGVTAAVGNTVVPDGADGPVCAQPQDCTTEHPIGAVLTLDKSLAGPVEVTGSPEDFQVRYTLSAANVGGSVGSYTLVDTPAFDPDAELVSATVQRDDGAMEALAGPGPWTLAGDRELAAGATEVYTVVVQFRVRAGSDTANDACTGEPGAGLFNGAQLAYGAHALEDSACAQTPVPSLESLLVLEKTAPVREAEVGDLVVYTVRIRNSGPGIALLPVLVDRLPAGFQMIADSVRVRGATLASLLGEPGPAVRMQLDRIDPGGEVLVQYRVRLGVGAMQGDGINRAHMECPFSEAGPQCSNEGRWQVRPRGGVFAQEGCVAGQIFVDANGNSLKDEEELGIPGVRMYFQDGTYMVSDVEGKYSYCGLRPVTHVLRVDGRTLPRGSRLVTSSNRNAGDAHSLFIDLRNGELHRADFIEGSASNQVLEQVKARRAGGEVRAVETEAGQPPLTFQSKPAPQGNPPQQGTDSADQAVGQGRQLDDPGER